MCLLSVPNEFDAFKRHSLDGSLVSLASALQRRVSIKHRQVRCSHIDGKHSTEQRLINLSI